MWWSKPRMTKVCRTYLWSVGLSTGEGWFTIRTWINKKNTQRSGCPLSLITSTPNPYTPRRMLGPALFQSARIDGADFLNFDTRKGRDIHRPFFCVAHWFFLRETITVDCAIYRLPLRSICKGKGKGGGKKEKNTGKGKGERKRGKGMRTGTGKGERGNGKRRKGKGKGKA